MTETLRELKTWLELDSDGIVHAGEHLRAKLHITTIVPSVELLLATIQLKGILTVSEHQVASGPLAELATLPGYGAPSAALYGGGQLFEMANQKNAAHKSFPIFSAPPSVIVSAESLHEHVQYSCNNSTLIDGIDEWIMPLTREMIPSYESAAIIVKYSVLIGLQFANGTDIVFERNVRILPAFNSQKRLDHEEIPLPFLYFNFEKPLNYVCDNAYTRVMYPERGRTGSVWDRCYIHGKLPKLEDFKKYCRHPLNDRLPVDEPPPSQASMFNVVALESQSAIFTLKSGEDVVALVKLGKTTLRLGEELTCLIKFDSKNWSSFQLAASLIFTETIPEKYSRNGNVRISRQIYRRHEQACWMSQEQSFSLSLPSDSNPTMYSNLFTSAWSIDFSLVCHQTNNDRSENASPSPFLSEITPGGPDNLLLEFSVPILVVPSLAVLLSLSRIANPETHSTGEIQTISL
ncbi:putative intracellular protein transport protein (Sat1) [Paramicrosporidium saccamoebae]|uniref:Putative intracellular protein transport protein (Sat1) n=1 Tax=Paramicrosporidium saccamoebae TaxID=1246581 RepID=A0A2H9TIE0_9FUNG|nr:putative intracellular protein transport protein (Sat1) [Paramicrosporidium saccamoebae]